jgi:hypothetical protein
MPFVSASCWSAASTLVLSAITITNKKEQKKKHTDFGSVLRARDDGRSEFDCKQHLESEKK